MRRRQVLALLPVVVAGCNATDEETPTQTDSPAATETRTRTDSQTATATQTPTETQTATETATPTAAEREGNEAIDAVRQSVRSAIALYGGPRSDSIMGIDAASASRLFPGKRVDDKLAETRSKLETARERAATAEQERIVEQLAGVVEFLGGATRVQIAVGRAYFNLDEARRNLDAENPEDAEDDVEQAENERQVARQSFDSIVVGTDPTVFEAVDLIDAADYDSKVAQFEAEIEATRRLGPRIETMANGVSHLQTARIQERRGSDSATATAERAVEDLETAVSGLQSTLETFPAADSMRPLAEELLAIARAKAAAAREIAGQTPTPTPTN